VYMYNVYVWRWSSAHALGGVSGVASFITTDEQLQWNRGCCFLLQAMLPGGFPFHQFISNKCNEDLNDYSLYLTYLVILSVYRLLLWLKRGLEKNVTITKVIYLYNALVLKPQFYSAKVIGWNYLPIQQVLLSRFQLVFESPCA